MESNIARSAYTAYTAISGGQPHGTPAPAWEHLSPTSQGAWAAAAAAVRSGILPTEQRVAELAVAASEVLIAAESPARHRAIPVEAIRRLQSALAAISGVV
jgi:hypothetical protein